MAEQERKKLDLDELFGQAQSITVRYAKKDYEFLRIEALGPRQAGQLQKMQKRASSLQGKGEEATDEESQEIEGLFNDIIVMLCPKFPVNDAKMTFLMKMNVITYYMQESQGKKAMEAALKKVLPTGQRRSRK